MLLTSLVKISVGGSPRLGGNGRVVLKTSSMPVSHSFTIYSPQSSPPRPQLSPSGPTAAPPTLMSSYLLARLYGAVMSAVSSTPSAPQRKKFYIGSRASNLALVQTNIVRDSLMLAHPELEFEIISMTTTGDNNQFKPLHSFGAKALWTQELEALLLDNKLDMIVHSLKDMPTQLPEGCKIGAVPKREDARDALVMKAGSPYKSLSDLPPGATVGTSSVRRSAQIATKRPDLQFADVRGNIGTRLAKLDAADSQYACLILASAGLLRLDLGDRITAPLSSPILLHAVGQGALGVEIRSDDGVVAKLLEPLRHVETTLACMAERALMRTLEGGCSVPIGVETKFVNGVLKMYARVASLDGVDVVNIEKDLSVASEAEAENFGKTVAGMLVDVGAKDILDTINSTRDVLSESIVS